MRIREIIEKQGITTKEVADRMEISLSAFNQHVSGNPSVKILTKIAQVLNVPIWELFASPSEITGNNEELTALIQHRGDFYKATAIAELEKIVCEIKEKEEKV